eukprot:5995205-Karenia_brevis.AAC.1
MAREDLNGWHELLKRKYRIMAKKSNSEKNLDTPEYGAAMLNCVKEASDALMDEDTMYGMAYKYLPDPGDVAKP